MFIFSGVQHRETAETDFTYVGRYRDHHGYPVDEPVAHGCAEKKRLLLDHFIYSRIHFP